MKKIKPISMTFFKFLMLLFFLPSCNTMMSMGDKYVDDNQLDEAEEVYATILKESPNDTEATAKLNYVHQKIIDTLLRKVQQQRLSNNFDEALNTFEQLIQKEKVYNVSLSQYTSSSQKEESKYILNWSIKKNSNEIKQSKYLNSYFNLLKLSKIFREEYQEKIISAQMQLVKKNGIDQCHSFIEISRNEFSKNFTKKYCSFWGVNTDSSRSPASSVSNIESFSKINISGSVSNIPPELLIYINEKLNSGFINSPYYSTNGKSIKATYSGIYNTKYEEKSVILSHSYNVKIPYQVIETVSYFDNEPYTEYQSRYIYSSYGGYTIQEPVTRYRLVTKYRDEIETHYRNEPRVFPYTATEYNLNYTLAGNINLVIDSQKIDIALNAADFYSDTFHSNDNPNVGLVPKEKNIKTPIDWIKLKTESLNSQLETKLTSIWELKYCNSPENLTKNQINLISQCIYGSKNNFDFINSWFIQQFGMNKEDTLSVLNERSSDDLELVL